MTEPRDPRHPPAAPGPGASDAPDAQRAAPTEATPHAVGNPSAPAVDRRVEAGTTANPDSGDPPDRRPRRPIIAQSIAVALILLLGGAAVALLVSMRQPPQREPGESVGPLVEAMTARASDVPLTIEGFGAVEPKVEAALVPQVSGRIESVHPNLAAGGFIEAGQPLVQLEKTDYEIALRRAEATLAQAKGGLASAKSAVHQAESAYEEADAIIAQAETRLETEKAEAAAALAEWRSLHEDRDPPPLLVRKPQIREAEAALKSAEAQRASAKAEMLAAEAQIEAAKADVQAGQARVREAEMNLQRTTLSMPFDGRVMDESIDVGQYVGVGETLATIYGTDRVQVTVPLADHKLQWLDLPLLPERATRDDPDAPTRSTERRGVPVTLSTNFAGRDINWRGLAVRTAGRVDPQSRLVHVIIEIADPLTQADVPLTPGMFVTAAFDGRTLRQVIPVPRRAIRENQTVWVADDERRLRIRAVDVAYADRQTVYVQAGLNGGDRVITSALDVTTEGMLVRLAEDGESSDAPNASGDATRRADAAGEPHSSAQPTSVQPGADDPTGRSDGDGPAGHPGDDGLPAFTEVDTAAAGEPEGER